MYTWEGKCFSITDPKGINTVIYQINKTTRAIVKESPGYTLERLDYRDEYRNENKRRTFYVDFPSPVRDQLIILSFGKERVVVNSAILEKNKIQICKQPSQIKFRNIYSETETELKDFKYTPNLKRPICIIDPETTEEIKPTLYYDEVSNEVRGKCKLKPYKSYFAFEIKDKKDG